MKTKLSAYMIAMGSLAILLSGCGSGGTTPETKSALHESTACISCHESADWKTPGTGKSVVAEWKLSTHNTNNGAGCADCHDDSYMHPASCSKCHSVGSLARNPTNNPDRDGKCVKCHDKINPRLGQVDGFNPMLNDEGLTPNGVPAGSTTLLAHYSTGLRTSYVGSNYQQKCRACHNPHDASFGREQRKAWTKSGHGNTRGLARVNLDAKSRGTRLPLDQNFGNYNYCVRCHTSTGFINFVAGDAFTDVNALPDLGTDGLPNPNGFRSNAPEYLTTSNIIKNQAGTVVTYNDRSREATHCNVCHLDTRSNSDTSSYSGKLRPVAKSAGVKIYYPYSSSGAGHYKTVTLVQFDTLGSSNLCLTCHSGRATGQTIRESGLVASIAAAKKPSSPSIHDFAGGAVLQSEKSAFLFYTSPLKYKTFPAHRSINTDGNGPCISCHMPKVQSSQTGGLIHSHLFRPVTWNRDDNNDAITDIISFPSVCSSCHSGTSADFTATMNSLRIGFRTSMLILNKLLPSASNWTGPNTNGGLTTPAYGVAAVPALGNLPAGVYTMGANYNYGFLFNEPSAYNHSPIFARQLIYDSIDWLKNGAAGFSSASSPGTVYTAIKNVPLGTGLIWTKVDPVAGAIQGAGPNKNYTKVVTEADRDQAFFFVCKDYVPGSNACNRW